MDMAYLYRHIRLDKNEVFYIGIGLNDDNYRRAYEKFKSKRSAYWHNIISKTEYVVEIMLDNLTWEEAQEKEKEFIKLYGRKDLGLGTLVNLTDGGENPPSKKGKKLSEETKEKIRQAHLGKKFSNESKEKMSQSQKGNRHSEETKKKMSKSRKGHKVSEATRQKISKSLIERSKNM